MKWTDTDSLGVVWVGAAVLIATTVLIHPVQRLLRADNQLVCAQLHTIEPTTPCRWGPGERKLSPRPIHWGQP